MPRVQVCYQTVHFPGQVRLRTNFQGQERVCFQTSFLEQELGQKYMSILCVVCCTATEIGDLPCDPNAGAGLLPNSPLPGAGALPNSPPPEAGAGVLPNPNADEGAGPEQRHL